MKTNGFALVSFLSVSVCGCAPHREAAHTPPPIQPFKVRVASKIKGYYTVASLNIAGEDVTALAAELANAGLTPPMDTGLVCEIWADPETHPKVIRFLSAHPKFREKILTYYAIPQETK